MGGGNKRLHYYSDPGSESRQRRTDAENKSSKIIETMSETKQNEKKMLNGQTGTPDCPLVVTILAPHSRHESKPLGVRLGQFKELEMDYHLSPLDNWKPVFGDKLLDTSIGRRF